MYEGEINACYLPKANNRQETLSAKSAFRQNNRWAALLAHSICKNKAESQLVQIYQCENTLHTTDKEIFES
jgi:hypothetical protein